MKNIFGGIPFLDKIIQWHSDRITGGDTAFNGPGPFTYKRRRDQPGSGQSTNDNSNMIPWAARGSQAMIDMIEQNRRSSVPTGRRRDRRNMTPPDSEPESSSSSSSSEDEDEVKPPIIRSVKGFMAGNDRRTLEIQWPVYLSRNSPRDEWFYNFNPSDTSFHSSLRALQNTLLFIPKDGSWPSDGVCPELLQLRKAYRHIKIDDIYFEFFTDNNELFDSEWDVPILSVSVTADTHPDYSINDIRFLKQNYVYDNNIYYQPINSDINGGRNIYYLPKDTVQDINKSSIGSWGYINDFDQLGVTINIGQNTVSYNGPLYYTEEGDIIGYARIGYVSLGISCTLGTPQGELYENN